MSLRSYTLKYLDGTVRFVPLALPRACFSRNSSYDLTA